MIVPIILCSLYLIGIHVTHDLPNTLQTGNSLVSLLVLNYLIDIKNILKAKKK